MERDARLPPNYRSDALKHSLKKKEDKLKKLNKELVKISIDHTDKEGLKKVKMLNSKLEFLTEKYEGALVFQETLKYMLDRDLRSFIKYFPSNP